MLSEEDKQWLAGVFATKDDLRDMKKHLSFPGARRWAGDLAQATINGFRAHEARFKTIEERLDRLEQK